MGHQASLKTRPVENIQGGREVGSLDTGDEQQFNRFMIFHSESSGNPLIQSRRGQPTNPSDKMGMSRFHASEKNDSNFIQASEPRSDFSPMRTEQ
jgi:hypothetical protein